MVEGLRNLTANELLDQASVVTYVYFCAFDDLFLTSSFDHRARAMSIQESELHDEIYIQKLNDAKKLARSELDLDEWKRYKFCDLDMESKFAEPIENIRRIHSKDVSPEEFIQKFEIPSVPCIIEGLTDSWPAKNWTFESLSEAYGRACLKCGEDDEGGKVKMNLAHFMRYLKEQSDDSPMYVFDEFGDGELPSLHVSEGMALTLPPPQCISSLLLSTSN
jgi:hypothetical protein